jgi:hypothetical protein
VAILSIATAGVALAVLGGVFAAGCLTFGIVNSRRESKVARRTKRRQRQAQALMATKSVDELKRMMESDDPAQRKCKVLTNERKHAFTRKRTTRMRTVDIRDNGYVAVQIRAHNLASGLGKLTWNTDVRNAIAAVCANPPDPAAVALLGEETAKLIRMLKAGGMDTFKLTAVCHQACLETDPEKRSALLRPHMAAALGLPWTTEKPLNPRIYVEPLRLLVLAQRKELAAKRRSPDELDYKKLAREFRNKVGEEVYGRFHSSMQKYPPNKREVEIYRIARAVAAHETPSKSQQAAPPRQPSASQTVSVTSTTKSSTTVTSLVELESQSERDSLQSLSGTLSSPPSRADLTQVSPQPAKPAQTRVPRHRAGWVGPVDNLRHTSIYCSPRNHSRARPLALCDHAASAASGCKAMLERDR